MNLKRARIFTGGWKRSDLKEAGSSQKNAILPLTHDVSGVLGPFLVAGDIEMNKQ